MSNNQEQKIETINNGFMKEQPQIPLHETSDFAFGTTTSPASPDPKKYIDGSSLYTFVCQLQKKSQKGGRNHDKYYDKYVKYKNKYLALKKQ